MSPDGMIAASPVPSAAVRWTPPLVWLALILVGTSWPNLSVGPDGLSLDKAFHFIVYMGLSALVLRATRTPVRTATVICVIIGIAAIGAIDEWHQEFIPRRSMSRADWIADTSGAVLGALLVRFVPFLQPRHARRAPNASAHTS